MLLAFIALCIFIFLGDKWLGSHLSRRKIVNLDFWLSVIVFFVLQHRFIHRIKEQETSYSGTGCF